MRPDIQRKPARPTIRAKRRKHSRLVNRFGEKLVQRDGGFFCHYCLIPLVRADPSKPKDVERCRNRGRGIATIDHKYPLSKGGSTKLENLVLACYDCNQKKGVSNYEIFIRSLKVEEMLKSGDIKNKPPGQRR